MDLVIDPTAYPKKKGEHGRGIVIDLVKAARHKYLRRIPSKRPGRKWDYIYGRESVRHVRGVQIGEKIKISHAGESGHYEVLEIHGAYATLKHDETGHEVSILKDHLFQMFKDEHQLAAKPKYQEKKVVREKRIAEADKRVAEAKKVETWALEHDTADGYRIAAKAHAQAADAGPDDAVWHRAKSYDLRRAAAAKSVQESTRKKEQQAGNQSGVLPEHLEVPFKSMGKAKFREEMERRRGAGLILTGKTYDWKEEIKKAGGVWDRYEKSWLMPSKDHLGWFRDRMRRGIQPGVSSPSTEPKKIPQLSDPGRTPYRTTVGNLLIEALASGKLPKSTTSQYPPPNRIIAATVLQDWTDSEVTELEVELRGAIGGSAQAKSTAEAMKAAKEVSEVESGPQTSWSLGGGSGYGHQGYEKGQTLRTSEHQRKKGFPEYVTVVKASKEFIREDGLSLGVGDEEGYYYSAEVRAATKEEGAAVQARIDTKERKKALQREVSEIAEDIRKHGEFPKPEEGKLTSISGDRLFDAQNIYGGGSWFVIAPDHVWYVKNNGADGDAWGHNNVQTGGAGATGWRVPRTDELVAKLKAAQKELGVKASV